MKNEKVKFRNLDILILLIVLSFTGCKPASPQKTNSAQDAVPVKVMKVQLKDLNVTLDYVGDIKAQDEAVVYPKVSGKIIEKTKEDGSPVEKGETIALIDRDETGLNFQKAPVESPMKGIIGRVYVDRGVNVGPQTPVALVVNMDKVKINLDIPEKYLPKISLGQEAQILADAYPEGKFIGKVTKVSPVVDLATRCAPIEIILDNPEHLLKSGMYAKVNLVIEQRKGVPVILKEAISGKNSNTYVFVVENNRATLTKIALGIHSGPYFEVKEGLKEGELVVIMGQQRLRDGAEVSVEIDEKQ